MANAGVVLIDFGDPPSLAALCLQRDPALVRLVAHADAEEKLAAVKRHHEVFGTASLEMSFSRGSDPIADSIILLEACRLARSAGDATVIWPVHRGPDFDESRSALDLASHVAGITGVGGEREIAIELPLIDLTAEQVLELIDHHNVPMRMAWPFLSDEPATIAEAADRWRGAGSTFALGC